MAVLDTETGNLKVWDSPSVKVKKKYKLDYIAFLDLLDKAWDSVGVIERVYVEKINAMPGQGVSSMLSFGEVTGAQVMGLYAFGCTPTFVRPNVWKPAMGCGANKDSSLIACLDVFGDKYRGLWFGRNMGVMDGRCEAALIALYGSRQ